MSARPGARKNYLLAYAHAYNCLCKHRGASLSESACAAQGARAACIAELQSQASSTGAFQKSTSQLNLRAECGPNVGLNLRVEVESDH